MNEEYADEEETRRSLSENFEQILRKRIIYPSASDMKDYLKRENNKKKIEDVVNSLFKLDPANGVAYYSKALLLGFEAIEHAEDEKYYAATELMEESEMFLEEALTKLNIYESDYVLAVGDLVDLYYGSERVKDGAETGLVKLELQSTLLDENLESYTKSVEKYLENVTNQKEKRDILLKKKEFEDAYIDQKNILIPGIKKMRNKNRMGQYQEAMDIYYNIFQTRID